MDFYKIFNIVVCLFVASSLTSCEECVKVDNCRCRTSKGTVNLHMAPKTLLINWTYLYTYQPCEAIHGCGDQTGSPVAICQRTDDWKSSYSIGNQNTVNFSGDPANNLQARYTTDSQRRSIINIKCDSSTAGELGFVSEDPMLTFNFVFRTNVACLGNSIGTTSGNKISGAHNISISKSKEENLIAMKETEEYRDKLTLTIDVSSGSNSRHLFWFYMTIGYILLIKI